MGRLRMITFRCRRGVWVLAAIVLFMQAIPLHLHLHHSDDSSAASASHVTDLHTAGDATDQEHHKDAHVIDLNPQGFFKQLDGASLVPLLFICLWAFLLLPVVQRLRLRQDSCLFLPNSYFAVVPPLRAPPRV